MVRNILSMKTSNPFLAQSKPKTKRVAINKDLREKVWIKYMGNKTEGKCYCCEIKPIHFTDFYVGHNKAVANNGKNHITNLRPICRSCNLGMKTKSIEWYKKKYYSTTKKGTSKTTTKKKIVKKKAVKKKTGIFSTMGNMRNPFG